MHADFNQTEPRLTATLGEWLRRSPAFHELSVLDRWPELRRAPSRATPRTEGEALAGASEPNEEPSLDAHALG